MRITAKERNAIKEIFLSFDDQAQVYLFGSRVHDEKKGGDLDLLVLSKTITEKDRRTIKLQLYDALGEQKIDLIIAQDTSKPFVRIAIDEGVLL